ncbi:hypothetical protein CL3_28190 [butyrate-producing bacterium SM4/1]|nr:hypothetical protein CLS_03260 [[Clostridium] cf. saccharolyticum K10]CBL36788.1 hypothetical protein CL3_28190 [butyrate-producing bacterium SM4/1]
MKEDSGLPLFAGCMRPATPDFFMWDE